MKDQDKTKEQLIADLEAMRQKVVAFEQAEGRRNAALNLLSELPKMLPAHRSIHGDGAWVWWPDRGRVSFTQYADNFDSDKHELSETWFEGKWDEIVHPEDLNSLMEDLKFILAGERNHPGFCFRTKYTTNELQWIIATRQIRTSSPFWGHYIDATPFKKLFEKLGRAPELSKLFRAGPLQDLLPSEYPNELIAIVLWDILINETFKYHPRVIDIINNKILPHYERIKSELHEVEKGFQTNLRLINFLYAAAGRSHDAVFTKETHHYLSVSPAFARLWGLSPRDFIGMTDEELFGDGNKEEFKEISYARGITAQSKLIEIKTGQTVTELMMIQMPLRNSPYGDDDDRWACGVVCNPREIEQNAELSDRVIEYESKAMRDALEKAGKVAKLDTTVLITGESGSGKEYVAKYIHKHSNRIPEDYFAIDCASIPPELAESELFGYEEGGHSQAKAMKPGLLEQANDGTILLDEIGDLPLSLQPKLLRFFDTKKFVRVGGTRKSEVTVNARIIAATNTDLEQAVQSRTFRRDLFYRINEFRIEVPPLRDRPEDIPILVREFLNQIQREMRPPRDLKVDPGELQKLIGHDWLGNVRQLHDVLTSSSILAEGSQLRIDLPKSGAKQETESALGWKWNVGFPPDKKLEDLAKDMKRALIDEALRQAAGKKTEAARLLGISRDSLNKQMKTLGISSVRKTHSPE